MPTVKPRITITLTDQQHNVLLSLSHLQKVSMSSIVVDLLDTTLPVLQRLSSVLANAATAPQSVLDELKKSAEQAEIDAAPLSSSVMDQLDFLIAASSGAKPLRELGDAPEDAAASVRPPTSNRGVRTTSPRTKIDSISPMKTAKRLGVRKNEI